MGSLNTDGTRITTPNRIVRNIGGGRNVFSSNRLETSSIKNPSPSESSNNLSNEQTNNLSESSINLGGRLKIVDDNGIGTTITEGELADLTSPNPPFVIPLQTISSGLVPSWQTWNSPITTWTTNVTWSGKYRIYSDTIEGELYGTITGAPNSSLLSIRIPSGLMEPNVVAGQTVPGGGGGFNTGVYRGPWTLIQASATGINVHYNNAAATTTNVTATAPVTWANTDGINIWFRVKKSSG